jgi:hypothetical protein
MPARSLLLPTLLPLALLVGCVPDKPEGSGKPAEKKERKVVPAFEPPVPYGKHVACTDLVDGAKFSTFLGSEIGEVADRSTGNAEATSVCAFIKGGTPPSDKQQERAYKKEMKLGVLPGDEICTISAFCWYPVDLEEFKKKCESAGNKESQAVGQFACVRETQRADAYAYTYRAIDNETQCILEAMGGPSVTDEAVVQSCMKAALDTIGPENIKNAR